MSKAAKILGISRPTLVKLKRKIFEKIGNVSFESDKLGGPGKIINIDETMLNYKCKSHKGRSPENKTDALLIVECDPHVKRVMAVTIPDKRAATILPIIISNVVSGSTIYTDEHRSYSALSTFGFEHGTVCHKYNFVDRVTGVHTQHVESFNNCIKQEIKKRK
jgi:transposase-like protein